MTPVGRCIRRFCQFTNARVGVEIRTWKCDKQALALTLSKKKGEAFYANTDITNLIMERLKIHNEII